MLLGFGSSSYTSNSTSSSDSSAPDPKVEVIVISGKREPDDFSDPLCLVDLRDGSSRKLPPFPYDCKIKSITVHENSIYVNGKVSSKRYGVPMRRARRPIFRYNVDSDSWEAMLERSGPPLSEYVFEVDKWLYITWIQAFDSYAVTNLSRFDLERQELISWQDSSMTYRHPTFVCIDKMVYALGGCLVMEDDTTVSMALEENEFALPSRPRPLVSTVQRLNTETNEWTQLAPLLEPKEELLCCAYNKKIYVLDGYDRPTRMSPQVYNIEEDTWEWGPALNRVYSRPATLVVVNNKMTFIDKSRFPSLSLERFSPEKNSWEIAEDVEVKSEFHILEPQFFPGVAKVKEF